MCAIRHNNNPLFSHEDSCALESAAAALQFAVGRHKALQQCQEPLKRLQTQKDGYTLATDVQGSHEIQEEVKKTEQSLQRSHGSSAIHDQETGQVHQVVSDLHIVSFYLYNYCTIL